MNRIIKSIEDKYLTPSLDMVKELEENALEHISGILEYTEYKTLNQ